jgi:hypothetical protein
LIHSYLKIQAWINLPNCSSCSRLLQLSIPPFHYSKRLHHSLLHNAHADHADKRKVTSKIVVRENGKGMVELRQWSEDRDKEMKETKNRRGREVRIVWGGKSVFRVFNSL